ncbi:CRISPR-associated exonuclease, Cas4 family [Staphylothermus marinus F1]|uniref:CRISPR-associated exonuclease Cas4 n=1 Tax=Staphylothermus marinus (strain ATCC 43588 / DSM 3639 / JCM 9404 / F1) TaxID=399550 RepID=A3DNT0_STAMF|nr:CRISPR-associated protein Cas4 [Staphylothermus marinus]ABN70290.1 CRISPR-associated exonuclease, Cas4 family [Staphylothermus marinus F1]
MLQQYRSSQEILSIIYSEYMKEVFEKLEESKDPSIIFVTDLVACTHKYHLRHLFPELTIRFEPAAILGDLVHSGLESILEKRGFKTEYPVERKYKIKGKEYVLKGRVDAYNEEKGVVVEIKTSRSTQNLPREHHVYQLQVYLNILNANSGILIYITPDRLLEFYIRKEKIDVESLIKMIIEDRVHPKWDWECKYCYFHKICPYRVSD